MTPPKPADHPCCSPTSAQTIQHPTAQPASNPGPAQRPPHAQAQFRLKKASSVGVVYGNDSFFINIIDLSVTVLLMVSTRITSRSNANPPRMQNQPGNANSRLPGALEAMQASTDEVEALRLTNQHLIEELEQLTIQMQRPREARQTQEGHDIPPHEGQHNLDTLRGAETEAEPSRSRGHGPHLAPGEVGNEGTLGGHVGNEELRRPLQTHSLARS